MGIRRRDLAAWPLAWGLAAGGAARAQAADPHAWLEEVEGARALEWVEARSAEALALVGAQPQFAQRRRETLESLSSGATNIPHVHRHGDYLYNSFSTARQPFGIWRRATLEEYSKPRPAWQILIDFDRLARDEGRNRVLSWSSVHAASERALVFLSLGGEDRTEMREFDLAGRAFVQGGFQAPAAKMSAHWFGADELLVATDTGPGSMTSSGYPAAIRRWKRGTPLAEAPVLLRGLASDVALGASGGRRDGLPAAALLHRRIRFHAWERHLLQADGALARLDLPADADAWLDRDWLVLLLRGAWTAGGRAFTEGSMLVTPLAQAASAAREWHVLFDGAPRRRQTWAAMVKDGCVIASSDELRPQLHFARWDGKAFTHTALPVPANGVAGIAADRGWADNRFWLTLQGPVTPQTLSLVDAGAPVAAPAPLKTQQPAFKAEGLAVRQLQARSADGTLVPYTVIGPEQAAPGGAPTLLYGYGGFGLAVELDYQRMPGINWLQYGGTYVIAHIRGGGEFGNAWYLAAKGARRQAAFDDFIAVAQDLIARGITSPKQLGIYGASNGGVLVTSVMVQRPALFGAVVSRVPLTDMLGFHKLFAGPSWMEEYGNPELPADREALARYSPYQNAKAASGTGYPPILFIGNRNDDRVHPAHARKMVAQLRALGHHAWLYEEKSGGHSGRSEPQIHALREALVYSFLRQQLDRNA